MDSTDTTLLQVNDLITKSERELFALNLTRDICTRERPVEDSDGPSEHALHGLGGDTLGVLAPLNGDGTGAADVGDEDGRANITRTVALDPSILGEDEAVKALAEILHHVVTLGLTVDEEVKAGLLLEANNGLNLLLDELVVFFLGDLLLAELSTSGTDLLGLLRESYVSII